MNLPIHEIRIGSCRINKEQASRMNSTLTQFLVTQRPFLKPGYSLKDLADEVHIPLHHLSAFINQYHGIHYNDFINRYRVIYFIEKISKEEWKAKKLGAIAEESGFSNRNTFTIAFRKITGQCPSQFIRSNANLLQPDAIT